MHEFLKEEADTQSSRVHTALFEKTVQKLTTKIRIGPLHCPDGIVTRDNGGQTKGSWNDEARYKMSGESNMLFHFGAEKNLFEEIINVDFPLSGFGEKKRS